MTESASAMSLKERLSFGFQTNRVRVLFFAHLLVILAGTFIQLYVKSFEVVHGTMVASIFIGATFVSLALKQKLLPIIAIFIAYLQTERFLLGSDFEQVELAMSVCDYTLSFYCFFILLREGKDAWQRQRKCLMSWMTLYFLGIMIPLWSTPLPEWIVNANMPFYGMGIMYLGATVWEHIKSSE